MDIQKDYLEMQIAFEKFQASEVRCDYDELKRRFDRLESLSGHRYLPTSEYCNAWLNWSKAWQAKASVVAEKSNSVTLNCNKLKQALEYGAPDLFSETKGQYADLEFQLETEMSIEHMKDGHSGDGYYCWYTDLPEEGSILLTEEIEAQEQTE